MQEYKDIHQSSLRSLLILLLLVQHTQERPEAVLSVSPQSWLTEGDSVTLSCEVTDCSTDWTFSWYRIVPYRGRHGYIGFEVELLSDSSRGSGGSYTISPAARNHSGVYMCRGERDGQHHSQTDHSLPQTLWITGESPPVSLIINSNRTQHFTGDSLSLSCEDQSNSTGWTVRRYTHSERMEDCSHSLWGSAIGSTCNISFLFTSYTGVYWCESKSGENSNPVNITVHAKPRAVLSVSPQSWLTEGDSVTLSCEVKDSSTGWTFSWYRQVPYRYSDGVIRYKEELLSDSSRGSGGSYTISPAARNHTGVYMCRGERDGQQIETGYRDSQPLWITGESPPVSLIINSNRTQHFTGDSLLLSCEDATSNATGWIVSGWSDGVFDCPQWGSVTGCNISSLSTYHSGVYWCESESGENSNPVNITVYERPRAVLRVSPQNWLTEGDSVTLSCEVKDSSTDWTFSWYRQVLYRDSDGDIWYEAELLPDSSRGCGGSYTISPAAHNHTGVYRCRGERDGQQVQTDHSLPQLLWITGESPPVSLIINPNRTQHVTGDSLSLSCEDQSHSTGWTVRHYVHRLGVSHCSHPLWGSGTGSTCKISPLSTSNTGVYWCESESGENSNPVNITVYGPVLSVSPQSWLTEGDSVTLNCEVTDSSTGWRFSWYRQATFRYRGERILSIVKRLSDSRRGCGGSYTINPAARNHTGVYRCSAERDGQQFQTYYSNSHPIWITGESPPVSLIINPSRTQHFTGHPLTMTCVDQTDSTGWTVRHSHGSGLTTCSQWGSVTGSTCNISSLSTLHTGVYWCESESGEISNPVNITVDEIPKAVLSVSPQNWLTEGDSVTLSCEVKDSSTDWTFSWYRQVPYRDSDGDIRYKEELLSDSSRGSLGSYTISPAARNHTGVYMCRGERDGQQVQTDHSLPQLLWITGESPPVSLIINPSRTQHFTGDSLSLSCEDQSNATGWTVRRYTHRWGLTSCSWCASVTGSTCEISSLSTAHSGVYWCESESGDNSNPVNITVHDSDVILESPVHPVTEGHALTLRCLYRNTKSSNLRVDFYKDGSVPQTQTTGEMMMMHKVSKSDEGFYHCKHSERGESPKSWVSVRGPSYVKPPVVLISSAVMAFSCLLVTIFLLFKCCKARAHNLQDPVELTYRDNWLATDSSN